MDEYNLVLAGGSARTVGPGGWTLGGGHSPITRMFGFGVDQVLKFSIVTADGSILEVRDGGEPNVLYYKNCLLFLIVCRNPCNTNHTILFSTHFEILFGRTFSRSYHSSLLS